MSVEADTGERGQHVALAGVVAVGRHEEAVVGTQAAQRVLRPVHRPDLGPRRHGPGVHPVIHHQRVAPVKEDHLDGRGSASLR